MYKKALATLCVVLLGAGMMGCESEAQKTQIKALTSKVEELQKKTDTLLAENTSLKSKIDELTKENTDLKAKLKASPAKAAPVIKRK